jgi:hypothetical protein
MASLGANDSFCKTLLFPTDDRSLAFDRATCGLGDNLTGTAYHYASLGGGLNLVGMLIRFTDLGIIAGNIKFAGFGVQFGNPVPKPDASSPERAPIKPSMASTTQISHCSPARCADGETRPLGHFRQAPQRSPT